MTEEIKYEKLSLKANIQALEEHGRKIYSVSEAKEGDIIGMMDYSFIALHYASNIQKQDRQGKAAFYHPAQIQFKPPHFSICFSSEKEISYCSLKIPIQRRDNFASSLSIFKGTLEQRCREFYEIPADDKEADEDIKFFCENYSNPVSHAIREYVYLIESEPLLELGRLIPSFDISSPYEGISLHSDNLPRFLEKARKNKQKISKLNSLLHEIDKDS